MTETVLLCQRVLVFHLGCFLLGIAVTIVGGILAAVAGKVGGVLMGILLAVTFLGLIVTSFAVQARRLHDINQTGWLVLAGVALNILAGLGTIFYIVIGVLPRQMLITDTTIKIVRLR